MNRLAAGSAYGGGINVGKDSRRAAGSTPSPILPPSRQRSSPAGRPAPLSSSSTKPSERSDLKDVQGNSSSVLAKYSRTKSWIRSSIAKVAPTATSARSTRILSRSRLDNGTRRKSPTASCAWSLVRLGGRSARVVSTTRPSLAAVRSCSTIGTRPRLARRASRDSSNSATSMSSTAHLGSHSHPTTRRRQRSSLPRAAVWTA
jgi:hypothetical protein